MTCHQVTTPVDGGLQDTCYSTTCRLKPSIRGTSSSPIVSFSSRCRKPTHRAIRVERRKRGVEQRLRVRGTVRASNDDLAMSWRVHARNEVQRAAHLRQCKGHPGKAILERQLSRAEREGRMGNTRRGVICSCCSSISLAAG